MSNLKEKLKNLEKTILRKDMPKEDKEKLLIEIERLKKILKDKKWTKNRGA